MIRCQRDRGAVTIEFAIVLIGVTALLAAVFIALGAMVTTIHCVDAAHTTARMSALGYDLNEMRAAATKKVRAPARVEVHKTDSWVEVTVTTPVPNSPWKWEVSHSAHAFIEPHKTDT